MTAWFLGPKAEHGDFMLNLLTYIYQDYIHWRRNYFPTDPVVISRTRRREHEPWQDRVTTRIDTILNNLKADFPFYSPRYIAHMTSEQTIPSILGYFAGMLYNPNNVTDEAAPVTVRLELEVGRIVAEMLGYNPQQTWAHLCSGGTVANLEALWVARMVQFVPLILQEYCQQEQLDFQVECANGQQALLRDLGPNECMGLAPNQSILMTRQLARYAVEGLGREQQMVIQTLNGFVRSSAYNVKLRGFDAVTRKLAMRPVIYASSAAHYCLAKVANILGYGEDSVRLIPTTATFRMDIDALQTALRAQSQDEYTAAVVGIVGSTEEGAVDPVHQIVEVRSAVAREQNRSFWLHLDAAWGGYLRSLFCGHAFTPQSTQSLDELCHLYKNAIHAYSLPQSPSPLTLPQPTPEAVMWDDPDVYKALLAMPEADSMVVDPHKLGYIPYPAGIVAFRNALVTELMTQRAQYISDEPEGIQAIDTLIEIKAVGPYILEGSKPGAAATACWLAHTTIPLTIHGHGQIMRATVLSAQRLYRYLQSHLADFEQMEAACGFGGPHQTRCGHPFAFVPLYKPDSNIVCFVCLPMQWEGDQLVRAAMPLAAINQLNRQIHDALDIPKAARGALTPYAKEYFVSQTNFEQSQYPATALAPLLERLQIAPQEYAEQGLIVLRSTVMNPLYDIAQTEGMEYLLGFVQHLHKVARYTILQIE